METNSNSNEKPLIERKKKSGKTGGLLKWCLIGGGGVVVVVGVVLILVLVVFRSNNSLVCDLGNGEEYEFEFDSKGVISKFISRQSIDDSAIPVARNNVKPGAVMEDVTVITDNENEFTFKDGDNIRSFKINNKTGRTVAEDIYERKTRKDFDNILAHQYDVEGSTRQYVESASKEQGFTCK